MSSKRKVASAEESVEFHYADQEITEESSRETPEREEEISHLILAHRENGRKLARSILRRWRVRMPAEEIDSIVDLALCEAARRYSSERGASFMTFFFYHLRGHLVRSVARAAQGNNVFQAFARGAGLESNEFPHVSNEVLWAYMPDYMVFGQRDIETPEHVMIRNEKIEQCQNACAHLDKLEKEIIERSFASEQPLVDIAKSLGYSRCHISRVKKTALDRLKLLLEGVETERTQTVSAEKSPEKSIRAVQTDRSNVLRRSRRRATTRIRIKRIADSKAA